jgi:hypothetical protein
MRLERWPMTIPANHFELGGDMGLYLRINRQALKCFKGYDMTLISSAIMQKISFSG